MDANYLPSFGFLLESVRGCSSGKREGARWM